jgi:hypothetical protein
MRSNHQYLPERASKIKVSHLLSFALAFTFAPSLARDSIRCNAFHQFSYGILPWILDGRKYDFGTGSMSDFLLRVDR